MGGDEALSAHRKVSQAGHLAGGGELGERIRSFDWAGTSVGSPETWPQSLKTAVRIMLTSRQPIWIGWGKELIYFYNDPYKSIIGGKHPWALGRPTRVVWNEIWDDIGPMLATAMGGIEGTYVEEQLLIMERNGYPEETYYTFSYSPIPDDDGTPGGIICANTDDTQRVIGDRQLALLRELAAGTVEARTLEEVCGRAAVTLKSNLRDLPFALIYVAEPGGETLTLKGLSGVAPGHPIAQGTLVRGSDSVWPFEEVIRTHKAGIVEGLSSTFGADLPRGVWNKAPTQAAVLPILPAGDTGRAGLLVVGLNPFRIWDEHYSGFLNLVAGQIAAAIANAQAYEEERRRAEALAELDRVKTTFFSNVSHEFRTPLTLMLGPLEEVLGKPGELVLPDNRKLVEVAHRNGLRLLKLVNSLLDFSRIEAGRVQARYEPSDIAALTAELASTFRSATDRAGLRLVIDAPPLAEPVYLDREMWEKVVLNLLSNAFKFTFEGEIRVEARESADGKAVSVTIRDTGTGIAADVLPRLFERFHRVEGARGRSFEGSGIGLALVQELVKLHGGEVRVESEIGSGSAFTVTLPFGSHHLPPESVVSAAAPAIAGPRSAIFVQEALRWLPDSGDMETLTSILTDAREVGSVPGASASQEERVLLADDNADMRAYVERLLVSQGFVVDAVGNGAMALARARQQRPDLILSDVMMPQMDGFALLHELRADAPLRDIPVVLLSARAGEEARIEGLQAGADDYVTKPFSARELLARVAAALKIARVRREAEDALREEARILETLNQVGANLAGELDLERLVQMVADAGVELTGAQFGTFIYNVLNESGTDRSRHTVFGVERAGMDRFPVPPHAILEATLKGKDIVRSDDIYADHRYASSSQCSANTENRSTLRSYLAVPVKSRSGEVIGGLLFGHSQPGRFSERQERLIAGIGAEVAIAMDNARLYTAAQDEIAVRRRAEGALRQTEAALREAGERIELALDAGAIIGTWVWLIPEDTFTADERFARSFSLSPELCKAGLPLEIVAASIHPDDWPGVSKLIEEAIARGGPYRAQYRVRQADGSYRWIEANGRCELDAQGRAIRFPGVLMDIEESRRVEQRLREREADLELLLNSTADGFYAVDRDGITTRCNAAFLKMLGMSSEQEAIGRRLHDVIHHTRPDGSPYPSDQCPIYRAARTGEAAHVTDESLFRLDGSSFPVEYWVRAVYRNGHLEGAVCNFIDISERKRAEEARQLLLRELNHRVKNLFAVASGMVSMTARTAKDTREMARSLSGRLMALARAHELIRSAIAPEHHGSQFAALHELVSAVIAPNVVAGDDQPLILGPAIELGPNAVTAIALVLHELATNAAKYGAFSVSEGRLEITWQVTETGVRLFWTETGGPAIREIPQHNGFGMRLAEMSARGQLGGDIAFDWRETGVCIILNISAGRLGQ